MINYAKIFYYYNLGFAKLVRFLIFILLFSGTVNQFLIVPQKLTNLKYPLFFLCIFIMIEFFFKKKVQNKFPKIKTLENKENLLESFTMEALTLYISPKVNFLAKLKKHNSGRFLLKKIDAEEKEISNLDFDKDQLKDLAFDLAKKLGSNFVTEADIFAAYFLVTEDKTKLLFKKQLKNEDLLSILAWTKISFPNLEKPKQTEIVFWGQGMAENWVNGWTIETEKYMVDLTSEITKRNPSVVARNDEYKMLIESLVVNKSTLIIGDPGSGRESLMQAFALDSFSGKLKGNLYHQRFFQLMVDAFLAGAENQGQLETRLDGIIAEVAHAGDVIIFIKNFENILGSSAFHLDISGALVPYIEKGIVRIVATITPGAFKQYVEPMHELLSSLQTIKLEEPDEDKTKLMLFNNAWHIEKIKNIFISYRALLKAIKFADKYNKDLVLPGSAIRLLDDASTAISISGKKELEEEDIIAQVERKMSVSVGVPKEKEKELLLHMEEQMHKRVIGQDEAVLAVSEAMRRLRSGLSDQKKPISFLFLGPTGVGKTETAKALAEIYYGSEETMIRLDMSEYSSEDGVKRLLGAMPGEGSEKGELTDKVYDNPYCLILLDEFEKANYKIHDLFLQVFDDGRLTDNKGKTVSFANAIIIATSNAASEMIREEVKKSPNLDKSFKEKLFDFLQTKGIFKPELINRFDDTIVFKPLTPEEVTQVTKLLLESFSKMMKEKDITITFDEKIVLKIASEGFDQQFGARPLKHYIQDNVENLIAKKILSGEIKRGDKVALTVDEDSQLLIKIN